MKKNIIYLAIIVVLIITITIIVVVNYDKYHVVPKGDIISITYDGECSGDKEKFYEDREYSYYFKCQLKDKLVLTYEDSSTVSFNQAFGYVIDLEDLSDFGIEYIKEAKEATIKDISTIILSTDTLNMEVLMDKTNDGYYYIEIQNNSDTTYLHSDDYFLEKFIDGNWYGYEVELNFNQPAYYLEPSLSDEIKLDIASIYGYLESGRYRIIKTLYEYIDDEISDETMYIGAEFIVE